MAPSRRYAMNKADASARLRYVSQVRTRTQRAAPVIPAWALPSLGALLIAGGLLVRYDHLQLPPTALLVAVLATGGLARRYISHRRQVRGGIIRNEHASTVAAILVGLLVPIVDVYLLAVAAAMATSAWISGQLPIAAATAVLGIVTGVLLAEGTPKWTALVVFGAGLIATSAARAIMRGDAR